MDLTSRRREPDADEVDALRTEPTGELSHLAPFGGVYRVDWIVRADSGAYLDDNPDSSILGEQVDLSHIDRDIACDDLHATGGQEPCCDFLAESPDGASPA